MAFDKIDPKVDFPAMEREVFAFWEKTKAFDRLREMNRGKPKWSFLDGPITANNPMGVHHAWGRTYKDIYQRYHASLGRELRYQNGFDCQGLWVEVEVEKEHGFGNKKDIEKFGIGKFVEACKARARKFAGIQTEQSKRLGYWMDWDNSYYTMSDENNYGIWAFLKKCHEKGLVYKGFDSMPWCPRCGTGISHMEMNEGYREVPHTSVFVRLPIRERPGENLLVWTTTPWTLSSNVAAAVHPEMVYVKVKLHQQDTKAQRADGEGTAHRAVAHGDAGKPVAGAPGSDQFYYVGKANFEGARAHPVQNLDKSKLPGLMAIHSQFKNKGAYEVVGEVRGADLVGLTYDGPFDDLPGAAEAKVVHRVIAWDAVTGTDGTGIVHIAPGCGTEDFHLGKELGLPQVAPLYEDGTFREEFGFLAGKASGKVADEIVDALKQRGLLFAKEAYYHRYPHCWRCKEELVFRLVDEWFINMNWREEIMESSRGSRWIPDWGLERELDWLKNMGDWMISKKRYWGLALPIWECHECGHFEVIGGRNELKSRTVSGWEKFEGNSPHRPYVDEIKIRCAQCGDTNVTRIKDVGNPWLDASIVPFSTMGYFSDNDYWKQWFPAEFVVEALPGQFRNWFYALLTVSTMMVGRSPFKVLKGHGLVMDDEGKPMHKSSGNAIEFNQAADQIGVDVMRWLYASTPPEQNVHFGPKHTDETRRQVIIPWWNVYSFFSNLARVDDFKPGEHTANANERSLLDKWVLSDLNRLIELAHTSYSTFEVIKFCQEAGKFIEDLSNWYVRRSRRRFYADGWPADKRAAYSTLYTVLTTFNRLIAPIMPFLSEMIYQNLVAKQVNGSPQSVHHSAFPAADKSHIDESLSAKVDASQRLVRLGRSARKDSDLKVRQPLAEMIVVPGDDSDREAVRLFEDHLQDELNVKKVSVRDDGEKLFQVTLAPVMKTLGQKFGRNINAAKEAIAKLDARVAAMALASGESVPVTVEGELASLGREDVSVKRVFQDGWVGSGEAKTVILLDSRVTPELKNEGIARDIVRNVQELRKSSGLDISDRIRLSCKTESKVLAGAIGACKDYVCRETLAVEIVNELPADLKLTAKVDMDGESLEIGLKKV